MRPYRCYVYEPHMVDCQVHQLNYHGIMIYIYVFRMSFLILRSCILYVSVLMPFFYFDFRLLISDF